MNITFTKYVTKEEKQTVDVNDTEFFGEFTNKINQKILFGAWIIKDTNTRHVIYYERHNNTLNHQKSKFISGGYDTIDLDIRKVFEKYDFVREIGKTDFLTIVKDYNV